jgi:hypothetical protein
MTVLYYGEVGGMRQRIATEHWEYAVLFEDQVHNSFS